MMKDSKKNTNKHYPSWVCQECGVLAHKMTFGDDFTKRQFSLSTWHSAECDVCKEIKMVTEPRDFFYPNFVGFKHLGTGYNGKNKFKPGWRRLITKTEIKKGNTPSSVKVAESIADPSTLHPTTSTTEGTVTSASGYVLSAITRFMRTLHGLMRKGY